MIDAAGFKQCLKDASDEEARALYVWATAYMEVRGLIQIEGAAPSRKRRSDAGQSRSGTQSVDNTVKVDGVAQQPSLSGLPDETGVGE